MAGENLRIGFVGAGGIVRDRHVPGLRTVSGIEFHGVVNRSQESSQKAAEEFGIVLCLMLVALFAFVVLRALRHAMRNEDPFVRFATAGLAILFGTQSAINMAVNLHLVPAKGMTLPFISYGGSSMISLAYGMGMLLALTRERPRAALLSETLVAQGQPA